MALARTDLLGAVSSGNPHGTGVYTTASFTPPSNSLLVVGVTTQENGSAATTAANLTIAGGSLVYTSRVSVGTGGAGETYSRIYTAPVGTGASMTLDLDDGALNVAVYGVSVVAYTGYDTGTPTGATATNTKTGGFGAPDAATATLSGAPATTSEVFAFVGINKSAATATPGAGWTEVHDATNVAWGHGFESEIRTGSTSTSVDWVDVRPGGGALFGWAAVALEIKADAGAAAANPRGVFVVPSLATMQRASW